MTVDISISSRKPGRKLPSPASPAEIERIFALIEAAAVKGERCPMNEPFGPLRFSTLQVLYDTGRVRCEIYDRNFRRIVLLTGPNRGKGTARPPGDSGPPWKTIPKTFRRLPNAEARP